MLRKILSPSEFKKYGIQSEYTAFCKLKSSVGKALHRNRRDGERIIKGLVSSSTQDRVKDIITPEALKEAKNDLLQPGSRTVFFNHDTNLPIGRVKSTKLNKRGLFVEAMISKAEDVNNIWTKITEGVLNAFSIRLRPKKVETVRNEETGMIEEFRILSMDILEVSVVGIPANTEATIDEVIGKSLAKARKTYNKKVEGQKMKIKDKKEKKKDKKIEDKTPEELAVEAVEKAIDEKLEEKMKVLEDSIVAKITAALDKSADDDEDEDDVKVKVKAKSKKKDLDDEDDDIDDDDIDDDEVESGYIKQLNKNFEALTAALVEKSSKRKGINGSDDSDDDEVDSLDFGPEVNKETVENAIRVCKNQKQYDALDDEQKRDAKAMYFQCYEATYSRN